MGAFPNVSTQFPHQKNPNMAGRTPCLNVSAKLRAMRDDTTIGGQPIPGGKTIGDLICDVIHQGVLSREIEWVELYLNRTEGQARQSIEVSGPGESPLFPADRQQEALSDPRVLDLQCQLDALTAATTTTLDPGRVRAAGQPGPLGDAAASGAGQP